MNIKVFLMNSFGIDSVGGNPAGVVLNAEHLTDKQKKYIAKEIGFSETAFVQKSEKADFKVTFFTPTDEVELCGHATIAMYSLLFKKRKISSGKYTQEIKAGIFPIEILSDGTVFMDQALPYFDDIIGTNKITEIFSIDPSAITSTGLVPQIVSTGSRDIIIPVNTRKTLFELKPDIKKMIELNKATNTNGYKVFTLETIAKDASAHSRDFAPLIGIPEESATGVTTAALACYLYMYQKLNNRDLNYLKFEQGYSMYKPSIINASLHLKKGEIKRIQIGGKALLVNEKEMNLT